MKRGIRMPTTFYARRSFGFTYLALLIIIALLAVGASATLKVTSLMQKRAAEEELLAIGLEFKAALISYANTSPPGDKRSPSSMQDLLKDTRSSTIRRHLRQVYVDPITHLTTWGIVSNPDGSGIFGLYSMSQEKPIKIGNFPAPFAHFENTTTYRQWIFSIAK